MADERTGAGDKEAEVEAAVEPKLTRKPTGNLKKLSVQEASGRSVRGCCLINPESNKKLRVWESITGLALVFVCFCTPYEVAFLDVELDALFFVNRVLDLIFMCDMCLQFFTMPEVRHRYGVIYIIDHRAIVKRYLRSWFLVDLLSILPFDAIGFWATSSDVSRLKMLRTIRLLRLLKLARLLRGLSVLQRWETRVGFPYRRYTLIRLMVGVIVIIHWTSCILGLLAFFQGREVCESVDGVTPGNSEGCVTTWLTMALSDNFVAVPPGQRHSEWDIYVVALHTATTIVIHPHASVPTSSSESLVFLILLCCGGWVWTQVLSRSAAISMSLDRHHISHHQTMDDLNAISGDLKLSEDLKRRLRKYFLSTADSSQRNTWKDLYGRMSPQLQADVSRELNRAWLCQVPFLAQCSFGLTTAVSENLKQACYSQGEHFGVSLTLYILNRGLAAKDEYVSTDWDTERFDRRLSLDSGSGGGSGIKWRRPGAVWGEEHLLLSAWWLLDPTASLAFTFVEVIVLRRETFERIVQDHPQNFKRLRRSLVKYAVRYGILYEARRRRYMEMAGELEEDIRRSSKRHDTPTDLARARVEKAKRDARRGLRNSVSILHTGGASSQSKDCPDSPSNANCYPIINSEGSSSRMDRLEDVLKGEISEVERRMEERLQTNARYVSGQMTEQSKRLDLISAQVKQVLDYQKALFEGSTPKSAAGSMSASSPLHVAGAEMVGCASLWPPKRHRRPSFDESTTASRVEELHGRASFESAESDNRPTFGKAESVDSRTTFEKAKHCYGGNGRKTFDIADISLPCIDEVASAAVNMRMRNLGKAAKSPGARALSPDATPLSNKPVNLISSESTCV